MYLFPYGSTNFENIEKLTDDLSQVSGIIYQGPMFIFYDQEPIYANFNYTLFDRIQQNYQAPFILVTTERDSEPVKKIKERYNWPVIDYFHHIFAASDWFRGYRLNAGITALNERIIKKKFITFNRITGNSRVYRSLFVAELAKRNLLPFGHISYSKNCPIHGNFIDNLHSATTNNLITKEYCDEVSAILTSIPGELRIDNQHAEFIQNDSMTLGPMDKLMESFVYIVTETCFWDTKKHLTEKIFKPIVLKQPFVLLGSQNNLSYLKEYGFKTFDKWWNEDYDKCSDPIQRINKVCDIIENICSLSQSDLQDLALEMEETLEYNYNRFFSKTFVQDVWTELLTNLDSAFSQFEY